jgi:flagellar motor protein MotB
MSYTDDHTLNEDEGAGYLISISDMMSGLLFVFIITLVAFIINFQDAIQQSEKKKKQYEQTVIELQKEIDREEKSRNVYAETIRQMVSSNALRAQLLLQIQTELKAKGIVVEVDEKHGVLRLTEQAIRFDSASASLGDDQLRNLQIIGDVLAQIIPCYSSNPPGETNGSLICDEKNTGKLDSVFLEGHTDNVPVTNNGSLRFDNNWELSALRAIFTFARLVPERPLLAAMQNSNRQPIFSVSGYGEGRPIEGHKHRKPTNDAANRRIDLRFIMTPPSETEAEKALKAAGVH